MQVPTGERSPQKEVPLGTGMILQSRSQEMNHYGFSCSGDSGGKAQAQGILDKRQGVCVTTHMCTVE